MLPTHIEYLLNCARLSPSADNLQPWVFRVNTAQKYVEIKYNSNRGFFAHHDHPVIQLSFGCLLETILYAAHCAELSTQDWEFPDFISNGCLLRIPFRQTLPSTSLALSIPTEITSRMTYRGPFQSAAISLEVQESLKKMQQGPVKVHLTTDRSDLKKIYELHLRATMIKFQIKELHLWLNSVLRMSNSKVQSKVGLDFKTLLLPPGGKFLVHFLKPWPRMKFLNRYFSLYRMLAFLECSKIKYAPAAVTLISNDFSWIDAGRLLQKIWLHITKYRLVAHPFFVLADNIYRTERNDVPADLLQTSHDVRKKALNFFSNHRPHFTLFIGYPRLQKIPRSSRLDLNDLLEVIN